MLKIDKLSVESGDGSVLLKAISLTVQKGKVMGLTGPSGAGKTTLLKSIMGVTSKEYQIVDGGILLNQKTISRLNVKERRLYCGSTIGYMPQNPMLAFNPRKKIGKQVVETLKKKMSISKEDAVKKILKQFAQLNLQDGERLLKSFPCEISGGMLQRIALALVLCLEPEFILADEPTSALDEDNKYQLLNALKSIKSEIGLLIVSHDVSVLKEICDSVCVMAQGHIIEEGVIDKILLQPRNLWTRTFAELYRNSQERSFVWKGY